MKKTANPDSTSRYRPEIDGLRALAVVGVVLFHAGLGVPGGFVGVDVFFVISGFLITGIILRSQDLNQFSLVDFWERRIRRIFPALTAMILTTFAAGYFLLFPLELKELAKASVAQTFFAANVYYYRDTGYFAGPADLKPLLHTWSLAVEEQFYFFLPVFLIALKKQSRPRLFIFLLAGTIASFSASVYGAFYHTDGTFYLLPTRAWELSFGCLLAASPWQPISRPRRDSALAYFGLIGIVAPMFFYTSQTIFPGIAALPPVAGATAIIYATSATRTTRVGRALSTHPLVFIGLISYSLYLWHWPLIVFCKYHFESISFGMRISIVIASFLLAVFSCFAIERPFRTRGFLTSRNSLAFGFISTSAFSLCLAFLLLFTNGMPSRYPASLRPLIDDVNWKGTEYAFNIKRNLNPDLLPRLGVSLSKRDRSLDFVVWGDSHGMVISDIINTVATEQGYSGVAINTSGATPIPNVWRNSHNSGERAQTLKRSADTMKYLEETKPKNLFIICRWSSKCGGPSLVELQADSNLDLESALIVDDVNSVISPQNASEALLRNLIVLADHCAKSGIRLWIVKQVPESGEAAPARSFLQWKMGRRRSAPNRRLSITDHAKRQAIVDGVFDNIEFKQDHVTIIDPSETFLDSEGLQINYLKDRSLYRDDDHLTRWGAENLRTVFEEAFSTFSKDISPSS